MKNSHKVIYVAATADRAHLLRNLLVEQGIYAYVANEERGEGGMPHHSQALPQVIVDEPDVPEAREIVEEFERTLADPVAPQELVDLEDAADELAPAWPVCPGCGRPRQSSCPICETSGVEFAPAFLPDRSASSRQAVADDPDELFVLCPTCDEPFRPEFPARCEWCGHRFGNGREPLPIEPDFTSPFADMNARVWIVIVGLAGLLVATLAFAALFVAKI